MFTDRPKAAAELTRVTRPGGRASTEALLCRARITGSARVLPGHHGRGRGTARLRPEDGLAHAAHGQGRPLPRLHRHRRHQARMTARPRKPATAEDCDAPGHDHRCEGTTQTSAAPGRVQPGESLIAQLAVSELRDKARAAAEEPHGRFHFDLGPGPGPPAGRPGRPTGPPAAASVESFAGVSYYLGWPLLPRASEPSISAAARARTCSWRQTRLDRRPEHRRANQLQGRPGRLNRT